MRVRPATVDEAEQLAGILAIVAEEGTIATEPPVDLSALTDRFRGLIEDKDPPAPTTSFAVEDDGRIVGVGGVHTTETEGVLTFGMSILPEARGRGGGRALMDAILDHARAVGAHKVELEVWPDNTRAIALYAAAGFEVEGLRRDHYKRRDGSLRSVLLMARRC
jgi:RimJ/RimL family protein N-acetyltransferase